MRGRRAEALNVFAIVAIILAGAFIAGYTLSLIFGAPEAAMLGVLLGLMAGPTVWAAVARFPD